MRLINFYYLQNLFYKDAKETSAKKPIFIKFVLNTGTYSFLQAQYF